MNITMLQNNTEIIENKITQNPPNKLFSVFISYTPYIIVFPKIIRENTAKTISIKRTFIYI